MQVQLSIEVSWVSKGTGHQLGSVSEFNVIILLMWIYFVQCSSIGNRGFYQGTARVWASGLRLGVS